MRSAFQTAAISLCRNDSRWQDEHHDIHFNATISALRIYSAQFLSKLFELWCSMQDSSIFFWIFVHIPVKCSICNLFWVTWLEKTCDRLNFNPIRWTPNLFLYSLVGRKCKTLFESWSLYSRCTVLQIDDAGVQKLSWRHKSFYPVGALRNAIKTWLK